MYILNAKAEPMLLHHTNKISWGNPTDPNFDHVEVYRRADQFQTDPASPYGVQIYSGTATTIYDYWLTAASVPMDQVTYPQIANTDLKQVIANGVNHMMEEAEILTGGQVYYYTIFCYDKSGTWYCSPATMVTSTPMGMSPWADRLWNMLPEIYQKSDSGQENDPSMMNRGQLQRLLALFAYAYEWIDAKSRRTTDLLKILKVEPDKLQYIADFLGWDLDTTLPLSSQRNALANALTVYHLAGTRKGLDILVKYYSGFPTSSGIKEDNDTLLMAPLFNNNQIYFIDSVAPDFGSWDKSTLNTTFATQSMDFTLIGTPQDPLKYCFDFSSLNKTGSSSFTAYVQPTYTLADTQKTNLTNKLTKVLDAFVPAGVQYKITIY